MFKWLVSRQNSSAYSCLTSPALRKNPLNHKKVRLTGFWYNIIQSSRYAPDAYKNAIYFMKRS